MLKLHVSPLASADAAEALGYYSAISVELRLSFRDKLDAALRLLCQMPGLGSHRLTHLLPGIELQVWSLDRFPFLLLYHVDGDTLKIVRIVHERRNLTKSLLRQVK